MEHHSWHAMLGDIAVCPYDVRLALVRKPAGLTVRYLVARRLDPSDPGTSPWNQYDYDDVHFLRGHVLGDVLSAWLQVHQGSLHETPFSLPVDEQVWVHQVPSNSSYGCISLNVPSLRYTMPLTPQDAMDQGRALIAETCPYFPSSKAAVLELLYEYTGPDMADPDPVTIVWPHPDAYLSTVAVQPLVMTIQVEGTLHTPVTLQVYSRRPSLHHMIQVSTSGPYEVPLPEGVPPEVHAVLTRAGSLVDRKIIRSLDDNVDLQDPSSLQALIAHGESVGLEFKRGWPEEHDKWLKTVVAFANRDGGVLIFGVDSEGHLAGVPEDANQFETTVSNQISARIDPGITAQVHTVQVLGNALVVIQVPPGPTKPYSLVMKNHESAVSRKYYYRIGSTSFEARPEHIRSAVFAQAERRVHGLSPYNIYP